MSSASFVNNRRIARNTLFLYMRMIVVMVIGLYTVRALLHLLGVVDYGIYNVVGGVVSMFAFLNGTLSTSSQRYFSIELARGDIKKLNQWFCLNITAFSCFIVIFLVVAETVGLWFVNTQMTIPAERLPAANVVYQLSVLSFCISFYSIPYHALIVAHERMSAFAYISIVEALLKLGIVVVLSLTTWDRLIFYAVLMFLAACGITLSYVVYNHVHFAASRYRPYWNRQEFQELMGFSGWHFLGTFSVTVRSHGINVLLNLFFSPAVNAARAVAFQVYHAVTLLSSNFFVAVKPQMYKSYAAGDSASLHRLIMRSTVGCTFLVSVLVFPILANTPFVLGLWLKETPVYTVAFTQLVLLNGLIDSTSGPTIAPALATGRIRRYQAVVASITLMNLPISFLALKMGAAPTVTMDVSIVLSLLSAIARAWLLRSMIGLPFRQYLWLFTRLALSSCLIWAVIYHTFYNCATSLLSFVTWSMLTVVMVVVVYVMMIINRHDLKLIINVIKR